MPDWQPNWLDIAFDHARARAAVDALRAMAAQLDAEADQRVRLAAEAQRDWRGGARVVFDAELVRLIRRAADVAEACRRGATAIDAAADDARLEQRRRVDARTRWHEERRREVFAAAHAR